jgi:hypothetical protein
VLLYETDDEEFADSALEALRADGIDCYRTGGAPPGFALPYGKFDPTICLHIRRDSDYSKANSILIKMGAAVNSQLKLPSRRIMVLIALAAALLAFYVAANWH